VERRTESREMGEDGIDCSRNAGLYLQEAPEGIFHTRSSTLCTPNSHLHPRRIIAWIEHTEGHRGDPEMQPDPEKPSKEGGWLWCRTGRLGGPMGRG
jgi:hypothetical protein